MRLLIIEDEPGIARFLKEGLEEEHFAVDTAFDGESGLELGMSNDYDLCLIDWMLPKLSGIEVCRQLRKAGSAVPVIFLTARDTLDDVVFGLGAGADDYVKKPFAFEELLARIRARLRQNTPTTGPLTAGALWLDPETHRAGCNRHDLTLTPKEFALLEYLLRNLDRVCTRSRIIEHVWDIHFDADTSVIDVYVNFLRRKLEAAGCTGLIKTVRGVGYVIRTPEANNEEKSNE
ncbi:MAG: DNA-binding response regulator [Pelodictyon luteolum]|uniref:Two component transcriptional regulator, winged helix family n=2 Tax=Pelodictyon luteolum TaxID=1100 RepID=Q3B3K7_CHLL3|nr:response regulator transcription factor [Pelodictyon luteolum]ABB24074.1 two component transcriptional regulator, winged helix family [Pelodictyon luteolum DSM 273]KZK75291.1 MAG: DNA-binding response regulator [Pelodictyon luteolum]